MSVASRNRVATSPSQPFYRRWAPITAMLVGVLILTGVGFASRFVRERLLDAPVLVTPGAASTGSEAISSVRHGDPALLLELGRKLARQKNWAEAEAAYRAAAEASPGNREAVVGLSDALYAQRKYEESAAALNRLLMNSR